MTAPFDFDSLPPEVRERIQAEQIKLLRALGIKPRFHLQTGALMVPLGEICRALGMTEEEARAEIGGDVGCIVTARASDVGGMQ